MYERWRNNSPTLSFLYQFSGKQFSRRKILLNGHHITHASSLFKRVARVAHFFGFEHRTDARKLRVSWEKSVKLSNRTVFFLALRSGGRAGHVRLQWNKWDFVTSTELWKIECNYGLKKTRNNWFKNPRMCSSFSRSKYSKSRQSFITLSFETRSIVSAN